MNDPKDKKKAINGNFISRIRFASEWELINGGSTEVDSSRLPRRCPFDAALLKPIIKQKARLFIVGILGILFGSTGIHFFLVRHKKKGLIRLGLFLAVGLLGWICYEYFSGKIGLVTVALCGLLELTFFIFGLEEGAFLCNLALYDTRMEAKRRINRFLSLRIGRITIKMLIAIMLVVAFIVAMIWVYVNYG